MGRRKSSRKPKTPPMKIPLPFEETVEALLRVTPQQKKKPTTKQAKDGSSKRKK